MSDRPPPAALRRCRRPLGAAALLWLASAGAGAANLPMADHGELRALAEAHALSRARAAAPAGASLRAEAARLDPRLRLPACATTPTSFDPPGQRGPANVSVGLRCSTGSEWTLYIPVRVEMQGQVVVLSAPLARGEVLRPEHLRMEPHDLAQLNGGWLSDPQEAVGMVLRRPLRPGQVLSASALESPRLVRRGQRVTVIAVGESFAVQTEGEALADAAAGERVRVRNLRTRSVVEGLVDERGQVLTRR